MAEFADLLSLLRQIQHDPSKRAEASPVLHDALLERYPTEYGRAVQRCEDLSDTSYDHGSKRQAVVVVSPYWLVRYERQRCQDETRDSSLIGYASAEFVTTRYCKELRSLRSRRAATWRRWSAA